MIDSNQREAGQVPFGRDGYIAWVRTSRQHLELRIVDEGILAAKKEVLILGGSPYTVPFTFNGASPQWQGAQGELGVFTKNGNISGLTVKLTPSGPQQCHIQVFPPYRGVARLLDAEAASLLRPVILTEMELTPEEVQALTQISRDGRDAEQDQCGRAEVGQHTVFWQYWPQQRYLDTVIRHTQTGDVVHASRRSVEGPRRHDEFRIEAKTFDVARFSYSVVTELLLDAALGKVVRYDMTLAPVMAGTRHTIFDATSEQV